MLLAEDGLVHLFHLRFSFSQLLISLLFSIFEVVVKLSNQPFDLFLKESTLILDKYLFVILSKDWTALVLGKNFLAFEKLLRVWRLGQERD